MAESVKTYRVFLGLGSNLGERHALLNRAMTELKGLEQVNVVWASSVYETDPVGKTDQPKFLNAAVEIETSLLPPGLLDAVKGIERRVGRTSTERWGPREIDLDILLYDGLVHHDERVKVPHEHLERRRFALVPLREIAPDLVHPVNGMTMTELAQACREPGSVIKISYALRY